METSTLPPKKKLTPERRIQQRMLKRIAKYFDKKFFIGDIVITDEEYPMLLSYVRTYLISSSKTRQVRHNDTLLAVALVQIGIRNYDGNYWSHVGEALHLALSQKHYQMLGESFLNTLRYHNKYIHSVSGSVQTILIHGFVSNYYSKGLFELLFQYYVKDLERNIYRNTTEQMQALMDTLAQKASVDENTKNSFMDQFMEKGSRAYKLRNHTLQAISINPIHSRMRLRRLLRLIDSAFWKDQVPKNPTSRLTILFKEWIQDSPAYTHEYKLYQLGEIRNRGKKHFSTPYLFAHIGGGYFELKLPAQIVPEEFSDKLEWEVTTAVRTFRLPTDTYPALTGYKTEEQKCLISSNELFGKIRCRLVQIDTQVRRFADIASNDVRFFDMEGDFAQRLFKIPMCAYTRRNEPFISSALLDQVPHGEMTRWDFDFQQGDLVILPDGTGMIVGDTYSDGLIPRGKLDNVLYRDEDKHAVPVYAKVPELLLTIPTSKIPGTEIFIDGVRCALKDCRLSEFDTKDSKGMRAILLSLSQFDVYSSDGIHKIVVNVPGAAYAKEYPFVYIKGLYADFDGAPYIFEERGTLILPEHIHATSEHEKLQGENGFQFELSGDETSLQVVINDNIPVEIQIPILSWSTDKKNWNIAPAGELWHTDFFKHQKLYLRAPSHKITFSTTADAPDDETSEEQSVSAIGSSDLMTVDLTRFKSWLTRDVMKNDILMTYGKKVYVFATVYTRSLVVSCNVNVDYDADKLSCICDIIGKSDYYMDIIHVESGRKLADKLFLNEGKLELTDTLPTGKYEFSIYEAETDDSGFDDVLYEKIYHNQRELINCNNLSGQFLEIRKFKLSRNSNLYTDFSQEYIVPDIQKIDSHTYTGDLLVNRNNSHLKVTISFDNLQDVRFFHLRFWHEEEEIDVAFLYDRSMQALVKDELPGLRASERYRRYRELDEDTYIYFGILSESMPQKKEHSIPIFNNHGALAKRIYIEDMGLSVRTYNALKRAGIYSSDDLEKLSMRQLYRIRNLGRKNIEELANTAGSLGIHLMQGNEN